MAALTAVRAAAAPAAWQVRLMARVDADRRAPAAIRHVVRALGVQEGMSSAAVDTSELLSSALATNAYEAYERAGMLPGALLVVIAGVTGGELVVGVLDQAPGAPRAECAPGDAEGGRGLGLVESLTREWGWVALCGAKMVWFSLGLHALVPEPDLSVWAAAA